MHIKGVQRRLDGLVRGWLEKPDSGISMKDWIQYIAPPGGYLEDWYLRKIVGGERYLAAFERRTRHFRRTQQETLEQIIRRNEGTLWGRDHKFSTLTQADWGKMPVVTYQDVEPYVERIRHGHLHALTADRPVALGTSTGTTARPKLIPFTADFLRQERLAQDLWTYLTHRNSNADTSRILCLRGDAPSEDTGPLPFESYLKLMVNDQRPCVRRRYILPPSLDYVTDLEHRMLIAGQCGFLRRPTVLTTVLPRNPMRLMDLCDRHRREILHATEDGRYIGTSQSLGPIRDKEQVLRRMREGHPLESVQLLCTWLGGTQYLFIDELRRRGITVPVRDLGADRHRGPVHHSDAERHALRGPEPVRAVLRVPHPRQEMPRALRGAHAGPRVQPGRHDPQRPVQVRHGGRHPRGRLARRSADGEFSPKGRRLFLHRRREAAREPRGGVLQRVQVREAMMMAQQDPPRYVLCLRQRDRPALNREEMDDLLCRMNFEYSENRNADRLLGLDTRVLNDAEFAALDRKFNPRQEHDRFKRRYLVPLQDQMR